LETRHPVPGLALGAADALGLAFGREAGDPAEAETEAGRAWLRAVAEAGRGRFAAARALTGTVEHGPFASAARCLEASMLRQSGRHRAASTPDGAALVAASALAEHTDARLAGALRVDATVGLAADALGVGRFALAARLLARADAHLELARSAQVDEGKDDPWWMLPRAELRREWVAAELAVYSGDAGGAARALPLLLAADPGAGKPRHHAKTLLIAASAAAGAGDLDRCSELALAGYSIAAEGGMHPLQWAGAKLVIALSAEGQAHCSAGEVAAVEARWVRDGAELGRL
jgi:hypothetical protein